MKSFLTILTMILVALFLTVLAPLKSNAALSNANTVMVAEIDLGSISADADTFGAFIPKKSKVIAAYIVNGATITSSDTDKATITLQNGSSVIATHISAITSNTSEIVADVPAVMLMNSSLLVMGGVDVAAGSYLKAVYDESGSYAMTSAKLVIVYYPL